jgi:two-component system, OmpR family, sensor histidine kinase BaeS
MKTVMSAKCLTLRNEWRVVSDQDNAILTLHSSLFTALMNRLVTRLALVIMLAILISIALMVGSQILFFYFRMGDFPFNLHEIENKIANGQTLTPQEQQFFSSLNESRSFTSFIRITLVGVAVTALISLIMALLLSRTIASPIEKVSAAAVKISNGDLRARADLSPRELTGESQTSELGRNFNVMAEALENYETERRAMIADIAHELRTPITALELRLEALSQDLVPFEKSEVERLKKQVTLLSRLVQDLRTLSLADAGQLSLQRRHVDVKKLVQECLTSYEMTAQQRQLHLRTNLAEVQATLDPERFGQILGNLLDNALRVTPSNGTVDITLSQAPKTFVLCIADPGPGIPDTDLPHIFERFAQARDTKGASTKGSSGLGLAVVQTLVHLHGGTVTASNRSTGGAAFRLELPLV